MIRAREVEKGSIRWIRIVVYNFIDDSNVFLFQIKRLGCKEEKGRKRKENFGKKEE